MPAAHINANPGDFAETVLMPGDPLRAKYIAESRLDGARQVSDVRNVLGVTGKYQGTELSVMASGMGIPSAMIYCTELIKEFGVQRIIRVGSCGTVQPSVKVRDIVIAMGASTDSGVNRTRFGGYDLAALEACLAETLRVMSGPTPRAEPAAGPFERAEPALEAVRSAQAPFWPGL